MSNIFRDLESFGKNNGKKWSQIWTFLFENCLKSPRKKKFFSSLFSVFFGFRSFLTFFLSPLPEVRCPICLEIRNPWGKVMERKGLRYEHFCLKNIKNCCAKRYRLTVFLLPIFLKIQNPWGKVMERSGLRYEHFCLKLSKIAAQKKVFFSHFFTFEVPFNGLFAPTSQSRMSNIFRDSESLGKMV